MVQSIRLRVAETHYMLEQGIAWLHAGAMKALHLTEGDILAIHGTRLTTGIAKQTDRGDDQSLVHINGLIRKNAGVYVNDFVTIKKGIMQPATALELAPLERNIHVTPDLSNDVKRYMLNVPVVAGDELFVRTRKDIEAMEMIATQPEGIVLATSSTHVEVRSERVQRRRYFAQRAYVPIPDENKWKDRQYPFAIRARIQQKRKGWG